MKMKVVKQETISGKDYLPGDVIDVPIDQARALMVLNVAIPHEEVRAPQIETTMVDPLKETTMKRTRGKRRIK